VVKAFRSKQKIIGHIYIICHFSFVIFEERS
jgi:hypothetical protein